MTLEESASDLERGDSAPGFELPGVDGTTHSLASFADSEALLVTFTCNHCPYGRSRMEPLNRLAETYDEVSVVGINPNDEGTYPEDSFERMAELVAEGTVRYDAYLRDESQEVARAYGAVCTPDPFLFGHGDDGFELAYHGRLDDATDPDAEPTGEPGFEMASAIESVLGGVPVDGDPRPSRGCSIKWK